MPTSTKPEHRNYDHRFFVHITENAATSAEVIVPLALSLTSAKSVVDVGCGLGAWLNAFAKHGIRDFVGIDGDYVDRSELLIESSRFESRDLSAPFDVGRAFDLAVCLEVAEHLPPSAAEGFVSSLVKLAPVILFSAAIPGQGGTNHLNEQWPAYWGKLFEPLGYVGLDCIRRRIWNDERVSWFYSQNILLFVEGHHLAGSTTLHKEDCDAARQLMPLIHPGNFLHKLMVIETLKKQPLRKLVAGIPGAAKRAARRRMFPEATNRK